MSPRSRQAIAIVRVVALVSLSLLLLAVVAAPLHKHGSHEGATCLICHATQRASVAATVRDAGKPFLAAAAAAICAFQAPLGADAPGTIRIPRAPPSSILFALS